MSEQQKLQDDKVQVTTAILIREEPIKQEEQRQQEKPIIEQQQPIVEQRERPIVAQQQPIVHQEEQPIHEVAKNIARLSVHPRPVEQEQPKQPQPSIQQIQALPSVKLPEAEVHVQDMKGELVSKMPQAQQGGKRVAMCLDASEHSKLALLWALDNFVKQGDVLTLIHVFDFQPVTMVNLYGSVSAVELNRQLEERGEKEAISLIKQYEKLCQEKNVYPHLIVLKGPVKQSICEYAERYPPDMMLVASRGMGAAKRWLLGSVSDYLVQHCVCPVMVVKNPNAIPLEKLQEKQPVEQLTQQEKQPLTQQF